MTIKTSSTSTAAKSVSRRQVLKGTAATAGLALGSGLIDGFPAIHAADPITIRYAGTGVNAFRELSEQCKADTGIEIQYTTLTSDDVVKRAVTQPSSFDLLDSEYWMLKKIVPSGNLRGMDISKVKNYDQIVPIFTKGELPDGTKTSRIGIAPIKVSYLTGAEVDRVLRDPDRFHDPDPHGLQRRYARHPARSDRSPDPELGRAPEPRVQGPHGDPQHPRDRHHGCRHGLPGHGRDHLWRHGQHDQGGDRRDHGGA